MAESFRERRKRELSGESQSDSGMSFREKRRRELSGEDYDEYKNAIDTTNLTLQPQASGASTPSAKSVQPDYLKPHASVAPGSFGAIQQFEATAPKPKTKQDYYNEEAAARAKQLKGAPAIVKKPLEWLGHKADVVQANIPGLADFQQGAGSAIGVQAQTAPTTGGIVGGIARGAGSLAGYGVNPAAIEQNLFTGGYKVADSALGTKLGQSVLGASGRGLSRAANFVNPTLNRAGINIGSNLTNQVAERALKGGIANALQNTALEMDKGHTSGKDILQSAATGGAFGAAGDVAAHGIGSAFAKLFKRNGMTDEAAAKETEKILALPLGREDAARARSKQTPGTDPIVNPYTFALPSPKKVEPVVAHAKIVQPVNPWREKYNQLIGLAHETKFTPGRELEELDQLWSSIAGREDPSLDELIQLAHPAYEKMAHPGMVSKAKNYQENFGRSAPIPIKSREQLPQQGVIAEAAPLKQKVGRAPGLQPKPLEKPLVEAPKVTPVEAEAEKVLQSVKEPRVRDRVYNFLDEQEKAARQRMAKRRGNINSNPLPEWGDMSIVMAAKMGKGTIKLADFTEEAVKEWGEGVRNKAPQLFKAAKEELQKQERRASKEGKAAAEFNDSGLGDADSFAKKINYKPTKKQSTISQKTERIRTQTVDDIAALEGLEKRVTGKVASAEKSIYKTGRLTKGVAERANLIVQTRLNPLISSVEKAGFSPKELGMYALATHAKDVNAAGFKSGFTNKEIEEVLSKYKGNQAMEDARKGLVKISQDMMQERVDSGVDSKELQAALNERWKNYIPLFRALDDDAESLGGGGRGMAVKLSNITSPVKKLVGSEQDVIDPLENLVKNIFQSVNATERNKVGLQLAELAKKDTESKFIRKLGNKNYVTYKAGNEKISKEITQEEYDQLEEMTKEERQAFVHKLTGDNTTAFSSKSFHAEDVGRKNVVNVRIDGENVKYEVEPQVYKALLNLDKESSNMIVNILAQPASMLRSGATLTPDFSLRNPLRDVPTAFVTSKSGFNPLWDFPAGLYSTITKGKSYRDFVDNLGAYGNVMSMDRNVHREALKKVLKDPASKKFVNVVSGKSLLHLLRYIADTSESATKVGEYRAALRQGQTKEEAAYRARDLMDFARAGSGVRQANKMVAFLNANIQGKSKLFRALKENPVGVVTRSLTVVTLPTVGIYFWNHSHATATQKNTIDEAPDWLKNSFWLVAVPGTDMVARIPKPFDLAPIFANLPERILKSIKEKDPKAFDGYAKSLAASFAIPTQISGLLPLVEGMANYSFFREGSIIPQREANDEYKDQYDPIRTTETAKLLAGMANKVTGGKGAFKNFSSPRIMDNTIQGLTAGLGTYATSAVDSILQGKVFGKKLFGAIVDRPDTPQKRIEQRPLVKSFLVDPLTNSRSLDKFYDEREKLTKANGSASLNNKKFEDSARLKSLNRTSTRISKIGKEIREIEASGDFTPKEKRLKIEPLLQERNTLAKKATQ